MEYTDYPGFDYSRGMSNCNARGVHYGIIPAGDVPLWYDASQPVMEKPRCPSCGDKVYAARKANDFHCPTCNTYLWADDCYPDEISGTEYHANGISAWCGEDGDIWIFKSPFTTYAQFCSPCAPGACYLDNPVSPEHTANKCFCLPPDWFDDGKCPYPVYHGKTLIYMPD